MKNRLVCRICFIVIISLSLCSLLGSGLCHRLDNRFIAQDTEADSLDYVLRDAYLELDQAFSVIDDLNCVRVLRLSASLDHKIFIIGDNSKTHKATLSVICLHSLDWTCYVAAASEGPPTKLL